MDKIKLLAVVGWGVVEALYQADNPGAGNNGIHVYDRSPNIEA